MSNDNDFFKKIFTYAQEKKGGSLTEQEEQSIIEEFNKSTDDNNLNRVINAVNKVISPKKYKIKTESSAALNNVDNSLKELEKAIEEREKNNKK